MLPRGGQGARPQVALELERDQALERRATSALGDQIERQADPGVSAASGPGAASRGAAPGEVTVGRLHDVVDAPRLGGRGQHHRGRPGELGQTDAAPQLAGEAIGAGAIGLVDHEQIGDLEQPGLHRLDRVARLRRQNDEDGVGDLHHTELGLPDADGLDDDAIEADEIEQIDDLGRRRREAPEVTAARQ